MGWPPVTVTEVSLTSTGNKKVSKRMQVGETVWWVRVPVTKPDDLSWPVGPTWWAERTVVL